jgi:uncharacterized protein (TIGR02145 family)
MWKKCNISIHLLIHGLVSLFLFTACQKEHSLPVQNKEWEGYVIDIEGNAYKTIQIGQQTWMAENLRTSHFMNGNPIPTGLSNLEWLRTSEAAFAWYDDDIKNKKHYGALYNFHAANSPNGLCPPGWRVPLDTDFEALVAYVVSQGYPREDIANGAGNALKACQQEGAPTLSCNTSDHPRWDYHETHHGFDALGFSGLPGGFRNVNGLYGLKGFSGYWWSSLETSPASAWYWSLEGDTGIPCCYTENQRFGFSIRCIKDQDA